MTSNNICIGNELKNANKNAAISTPQIKLSCATSSISQADSHDSSPENVFEQVGTGTLQETLDLNYREKSVLEPLNLTEEATSFTLQPERGALDYLHERSQQIAVSSIHISKYDEHQTYLQQHQRKDSASSEVAALLCISGRSSRISSVCSQGSAISRLSAVSGISRSPSPHRMLLETSFCGPKPSNNLIDGNVDNVIESTTVSSLEQILLSRTQDPTKAVFAEGIQVELQSDITQRPTTAPITSKEDNLNTANAFSNSKEISDSKISPGQIIIGKTASGTDYIRINLKPHYMYNDKGIAPNERIVEAPNTLAPIYALNQTKPNSLTLSSKYVTEKRELPCSSIVPESNISPNEPKSNRSPLAALPPVSRKSSFGSLFRFGGKDSPDLSKERFRSKCTERTTVQAITSTPTKQKVFLTIFKPGKRASSADSDRTKTSIASSAAELRSTDYLQNKCANSESNSRLRYYDEPKQGIIHIPLHTPPDEKEVQKVFQDGQNLGTKSIKPIIAPIRVSDLVAAAANLKPVLLRNQSQNTKQMQSEENLDAIHIISKGDNENNSVTYQNNSCDTQKPSKEIVHSSKVMQNIQSNIFQNNKESNLDSFVDSSTNETRIKFVETKATINSSAISQRDMLNAKEKRSLLFATRLGSGSQEDVFSTQFSISKTESLSSHMSEEHAVETFIDARSNVQCFETNRQSVGTPALEKRSTRKKNFLKRTSSIETKPAQLEDEKIKTSISAMVDSNIGDIENNSYLSCSQNNNLRTSLEDNIDVTCNYNKDLQLLDDFEKVKDNYFNVIKPHAIKEQQSSTLNKQNADAIVSDEVEQNKENFSSLQIYASGTTLLPSASLDINTGKPKEVSYILSQLPSEQNVQLPQKISDVTTLDKGIQDESKPALHSKILTDRDHRQSTQESFQSSESEKYSETAVSVLGDSKNYQPSNSPASAHVYTSVHTDNKDEYESTGLVAQESFEDELPYIPTTLPEERSQGVLLIPVKERIHIELKTCPLERPRSATPLNPSQLEDYVFKKSEQNTSSVLSKSMLLRGDKLRISLPKADSKKHKQQYTTSPRKLSKTNVKLWSEFAEHGLRAIGNLEQKTDHSVEQQTNQNSQTIGKSNEESKLKLQISSQRKLSGHWIDFENIPEKRKPPKRITTLPKEVTATTERSHTKPQTKLSSQKLCSLTDKTEINKLIYNYVKPEDCHCECHEIYKENKGASDDLIETHDLIETTTDVHLLQRGDDALSLIDRRVHKVNEANSLPTYSNYVNDECQISMQIFDMVPDSCRINGTQLTTANSSPPNK